MLLLRDFWKRWWLPLSLALVAVSCVACIVWVDRIVAKYYFRHPELQQVKVELKYWTQWSEAEFYLVASFAAGLVLFGIAWVSKTTALGLAARLYARRSAFIGCSIACSGAAVMVLKFLVGRSRPNEFLKANEYGKVSEYVFLPFSFDHQYQSFPSGHAATSVALAGALAVLFPRLRWPLLLLGVGMAFIRVVITAHYLSDFIAGCYLGLLGVLAARWFFESRGYLASTVEAPAPEPVASTLASETQ